MFNKPVTVLRILLQGGEIEKNNKKYCFDDKNNLCVRRTLEGKDVFLKVNFGMLSLSEFIEWANGCSDESLITACGEVVLNNLDSGT